MGETAATKEKCRGVKVGSGAAVQKSDDRAIVIEGSRRRGGTRG